MTRITLPALIIAVLLFGSGCAKPDWIQQTLVTVDVTGTWVGTIGRGGATHADVRLEMEQDGSRVTGTFRLVGAGLGGLPSVRSGPIEGSVTGDVFRFKRTEGLGVAELLVNQDEMTGLADVGSRVPIFLRRTSSASPPSQP